MKCLIQCDLSSNKSLIGTWDLTMEQPNENTKSWICDVDENGVLTFTDELWEFMRFAEGEALEFVKQDDGSFILRKVDPENNDQDCQG